MFLAVGACKLLLLLVFLIGEWYCLRGKLKLCSMLMLSLIMVLFSATAQMISEAMPSLTDQVTLTALGEKRPGGEGTEIFLAGFTIDGDSLTCEKALRIEEGHWFWSGSSYCWRPETDSRQPDGITRTITVKIPVGEERSFQFNGGVWRGFVEITAGGRTWTADTYADSRIIVSEPLGSSEWAALALDQLYHFVVYATIFLLLSTGAILVVRVFLRNPKLAHEWMERNSGRLVCISIALVMFGLMIHFADRVSLWSDELFQIACTNGTIREAVEYCLKMNEATPPLSEICATIWYHIAPYGETWLHFPAILLSTFSVILIGIIGDGIGGKYCGISAAAMLAFSETLWSNAAYEYRAYSYFIFFSVLTYYCHICRIERRKGFHILYSVSLLGLAMSHYFGMLACAFFFSTDLYLLARKQLKIKDGFSYLLPGGVSVFWLAAVFEVTLQHRKPEDIASWYPVPGFSHIRSMLQFLSGNFEIAYWILLVGIAVVLAGMVHRDRESFRLDMFYLSFSTLEIIGTLTLLLLYGNFVNKESTMWQGRYFLGLLPHVVILSASVLHRMTAIAKDCSTTQRALCLFVISAFSLNCLSVISNSKSTLYPYQEAADWIYAQSNFIFNDDTLVMITDGNRCVEGFNEYYITRQGKRDQINVSTQYAVREKDMLLGYSKVYFQYAHIGVLPDVQAVLDEFYVLETDKKDIKVRVYKRK